ncbi:GNAT family N-acetyltransferase [Miniphocaeibacter massiliensis]|uniref:GNAT family N-acetyltransferase n=1 Tax=Miniphocaeibacter massiliensis TaxID=2041841 RepID=UPI000C1C7A65|nr:GNAT family N-acetyltransferase [Miniphocaeibacter massiliensis]
MNYVIDRAKIEDAKEIVRYLKDISLESDNLIMTKEQADEMSEADEGLIIDSYKYSKTSLMLVAKLEGEIISLGSLKGNTGRASHRVTLGVTVKKDYWNKGIGREMIDSLLRYAAGNEYIEIVDLTVKSDNYGAISLYERFGFEKIGYYENYFKYENGYGDAILMNLYL